MGRCTRMTEERRRAFLAALRRGATVAVAARAAGVARSTAYAWRERDERFAAAWDDALEDGTDVLEEEALRRALAGSDTLLIFLLKARRPEKYRDSHHIQHDGAVRVEVVTTLPDPDEDSAG